MNKGLGSGLILVSVFISGCMITKHQVSVNPSVHPKKMTLQYKILQVPLYAQATRMWCWAASGEMIMHYYGEDVPQHVQANNRFGRDDCGARTRPGSCNRGGWPQFKKYGFNPPESNYGALSWRELVKQINTRQPVGFSWEWKKCNGRKSFGSHYMVARGYIILNDLNDSNDTRLVVVNDPLPLNTEKTTGGTISIMTYSDYVQFCPRYIHSYTHYDISNDKKRKVPGKPELKAYVGGRAANPTPREGINMADAQKQMAAIESLELLKTLPWKILKELGVDSRQTVEKMSLGKPLYTSGIGFSSKRSQGMGKIPEDVVEIHYPVNVDEEPVISITIRKRKEKWALAVFNERGALCAIKARRQIPAPRGYTPDYFTVSVHSMNLTFLAYVSGEEEEEDNILYLIPIHEDPDLTFPLYVPVPAEEVFLELKYVLEKYAEEKGGAALKNNFIDSWKNMDEVLYELESGVKTEVLEGMERGVEIINHVFGRLEDLKEVKNKEGKNVNKANDEKQR